jgi:hypothetical protein
MPLVPRSIGVGADSGARGMSVVAERIDVRVVAERIDVRVVAERIDVPQQDACCSLSRRPIRWRGASTTAL